MHRATSAEMKSLSNDCCVICAEFFDLTDRIPSLVQCGHSGICSVCFLRIRSVLRDFNCPQCKQNCDTVICTPDTTAVYNDFEVWGEKIPGFSYDHTSRMFFPPEHYKSKIEALRKSGWAIVHMYK